MSNPFHHAQPGFQRLLIFGAGGHGREIAWLAEQCWERQVEVIHVVDQPQFLGPAVNEREVRLLVDCLDVPDARYVVALGDPDLRKRKAELFERQGFAPVTMVHPRVEASSTVALQHGCVVFAGSVLSTNATLGAHTHVNMHCTISHDVSVGDFCTISPGAHVSGHVQVGHKVFIGTGATIINGQPGSPLIIGDGAVVAAGACVTQSVAAGAMMAGVPAIRKR